MENFTNRPNVLNEAIKMVEPHFPKIHRALMSSYTETKNIKDGQIERGVICDMTQKTKGGIMSDALSHFLGAEFNGIEGVKVTCIDRVPGLLFEDSVFVKFNKMNNSHSPSIQQRKWYKEITNQGSEIEGIPASAIKMWAGIVPIDSAWSDVARCALVYYEGGGIVWSTDMKDSTVEQLSIDISPEKSTRRAKPKQIGGDQEKTGTENI